MWPTHVDMHALSLFYIFELSCAISKAIMVDNIAREFVAKMEGAIGYAKISYDKTFNTACCLH